MVLYDIIAKGATEYPDRTALIFRDTAITYGHLAEQVNRLAWALKARGIRTGSRVALLLPNCPQFTVAYYATTALGAVCVPRIPCLSLPSLPTSGATPT